MTIPPVAFNDLEVSYGENVVLHGIAASVTPGSCVAITGSNGSGKSTLVKAILGIAPVSAGSIRLYGEEKREKIPWRRIGYVPQRMSVGGGVSSTVREVVLTGLLGPRQWWLPRRGEKKLDEVLDHVGLSHRKSDAFSILSGGQQQRALIARALIRHPDLLMLDEPLTGLDAHNRKALADIVGKHKEQGHTSMIVLHELGELAPLVDRELRISAGHIVHDGPCTHAVHELHSHHEEPTMTSFELGMDVL